MMMIGCDYHPSWQQICWLDTGDGRDGRKEAGTRVGRGGEVLSRSFGACADWDGVDGELPVVCGDGDVGGT